MGMGALVRERIMGMRRPDTPMGPPLCRAGCAGTLHCVALTKTRQPPKPPVRACAGKCDEGRGGR